MRECAKLVVLAIVISLIGSCSTTKYVPVETIKVKYDTAYVSKLLTDSVYCRDSIYVESRSDTVFLSKYKYLYKYKEVHDTLWQYSERIDTVTSVKEVPAKLSKMQSLKMTLGEISMWLILLSGVFFIGKFIRR